PPLTAANSFTEPWSSTTLFNGGVTWDAYALDTSGNISTAQNASFQVQNQLQSISFSGHVCFPATPTCPRETTPLITSTIATEAAVHATGTLTLTVKNSTADPIWGAGVTYWQGSFSATGYCGSLYGDPVDCDIPDAIHLLPNSGKGSATD